jgi:hypothetical protein
MTPIETDILNTLIAFDTAVASMATANPKPDLLAIFTKLDVLTQQLPSNTAPDLLHYLHKKSYQKARLWLEDQQSGRETKDEGRGLRAKENHIL